MKRSEIESGHVIERYLASKLFDRERDGFEANFVADAGILDEMEAIARFKIGLAVPYACDSANPSSGGSSAAYDDPLASR